MQSWLPSCCHHTLCNSWQQQCTHQLYFERDSVKIFRKRLMRLQRTEWWSHFPCLDRFDWYAMQCHTSYTMLCLIPWYDRTIMPYHGVATIPLLQSLIEHQALICFLAQINHWNLQNRNNWFFVNFHSQTVLEIENRTIHDFFPENILGWRLQWRWGVLDNRWQTESVVWCKIYDLV